MTGHRFKPPAARPESVARIPRRSALAVALVLWIVSVSVWAVPGRHAATAAPAASQQRETSVPSLPYGHILWLMDTPAMLHAQWAQQNFASEHLVCTSVACIRDKLEQLKFGGATTKLPVYLIGDAGATDLVKALFSSGLTAGDLAGAVLLRVDPASAATLTATPGSPRLLTLVEHADPQPTVTAARKLAADARAQGAKSLFLFASDTMLTLDPFNPTLGETLMFFMGRAPLDDQLLTLLKAYARWQHPPFDNDAFWQLKDHIRTVPATAAFEKNFRLHYRYEPHQVKQMPFAEMTVFDLVSYRDAAAPDARYIRFDNLMGTVFALDLQKYAPYQPVLVIGLDDETNMHRFAMFYQTKLMYSWKPDVQNLSAQPLGPRLEFLKPPPAGMAVGPLKSQLITSAITLDGISFSQTDPLAEIQKYTDDVRAVITEQNKCVYCHGIADIGARAHHLDALTGQPQGGFALPLAEYSPAVMTAFLTEQADVAKRIGMTPNAVPEPLLQAFSHWAAEQRARTPK